MKATTPPTIAGGRTLSKFFYGGKGSSEIRRKKKTAGYHKCGPECAKYTQPPRVPPLNALKWGK